MNTKEFVDAYYKDAEGTYKVGTRFCIDSDVLYDYVEETSKELFEMNADELVELIARLVNGRDWKSVKVMKSQNTYANIISALKDMINWYIIHVKPVPNIIQLDSRFRGKNYLQLISDRYAVFSYEVLQNAIKNIREKSSEGKADYVEYLCLLFYSGFQSAEEVISFRLKDVDPRARTVKLIGRTVKMTERCYELYKEFWNIDSFVSGNHRCYLCSLPDRGFRFLVRDSEVDTFHLRDEARNRNSIYAQITKNMKDANLNGVNYKTIFMLGLYDYMVRKFGKARTNQIILCENDERAITQLNDVLVEYGLDPSQTYPYKKYLVMFAK